MMKKSTIIVLALVILAACGRKDNEQKNTPVRVETEVVTGWSSDNGVTYVGVVEESEATAVSFTSMGVIKRMLVSEGQSVSRGQLLAVIDPSTSSNTLEMSHASTNQARDMVKQAESTYQQAKDAYDRMKILHDNGSLPEIKWVEVETRLRQAETALSTARSGVASAQAAENIARKSAADTRLVAPVSGVIGKRQLDVGETALPSQAVLTILDISTVKVKVSIPESELKNIGPNTQTSITVEAINKGYNGGRIEKGVEADMMTHTYDIRINVSNPGHQLLPGMVATVRFPSLGAGGQAGVFVPITAVQRRPDGGSFIWTIDSSGKAHRTSVTLGSVAGNKIAITAGLRSGERIVTEGYQKLSEGSPVVY